MTDPRIDRPQIPAEYGVARATEWVDWAHVEERLVSARVYWIATIGPSGRPRVRPVDGLYVDGVLYVGGSGETRWVRDLAANPKVSVHLDIVDGDVVIVDGDAEVLQENSDEFAERMAAASGVKYPEYGMTPESYKGPGPIAIRPRKVIAWTDFMKDPTRFRFR
ncbi:MAG TPA: pyridoxamine 5'-phosphate oxidase family protein [Candidatus Limnocylindrales bacterium]|nr:pyridoxamine 5'-phosphate oxidase family protein [Candidatus Limnocylindrales bacterium]